MRILQYEFSCLGAQCIRMLCVSLIALSVCWVNQANADSMRERINSDAFRKVFQYQFSKMDSTAFYAKKSAEEARSARDSGRYILMLSLESVAMVDMGKSREGFAHASSALKLVDKFPADTLARAYALYAVGYASGQQITNKTNEALSNTAALQMLRESLVLCSHTGDSLLQMQVMNSIGRIFRKMKEWDSATVYHEGARALASALGVTRAEAWAWHSISTCYEGKGNIALALVCSLEALRLREIVGLDLSTSISLQQVSKLYSALGKQKEALDYAKRNIAVAERSKDLSATVSAWLRIAEVQGELGNFSEALTSFRQYKQLHDSLHTIEFLTDIRILQKETEYERIQEKNRLLEIEQEKEAAIRRRQWIIIWLVIAIALGLSFLSVQLVRSRRKTEEQNIKLAALDAEKNEILGIVSHDLKNPIGAVRGLAELMQQGYVEQAQLPEIAGTIVGTADRMLELVKNLLDINQLESGGKRFQLVEFDIAPMVESNVWQHRPQAEAKNITLHFSAESSPNRVLADEQAMMQVLDNLISNAVKYSPHGKNVFLRLKASHEAVRVEVQDEGPGISPDDMKKLFGKFARLSARPTGGEHSTGLGLSIVKKMVEAMNGRVWCESELGKGATFIVELPVSA